MPELNVGGLLSVAFLAIVWGFGIASPFYRTARFLGLLAVGTGLILGARLIDGVPDRPVSIGVVIVLSLALAFAERLGIGSLTRSELKLDGEIRGAFRMSTDPTTLSNARAAVDDLLASTAVPDPWRPGLRAVRCAWSARETAVPASVMEMPAEWFESAGRRSLADARARRILGAHHHTGSTDESLLLRAYLNDLRTTLPPGPLGPDAAPSHEWAVAARAIIAELERARFRTTEAREVRDRLGDLLGQEVDMRTSGPTDDDAATYERMGADLVSAWGRLDALPREPGTHGA